MFTLLIFFFPCIFCIIWTVQFLLRPDKTASERIFIGLSAASAIYFFAEANYISLYEDYRSYVIADAASQVARPLIPAFMLMYLLSIIRGKCCNIWAQISLAIGIALGSISLAIYFMIGLDDAANYQDMYDEVQDIPANIHNKLFIMHQIFCVYAYRTVIIIHSIIGVCYISWLFHKTRLSRKELCDFFFRNGDIEPQHIIALLFIFIFVSIPIKFALGRYFFLEHQGCAILFVIIRTMLIYMIGFLALYGRWATVNLRTMFSYVMPAHTFKEDAPEEYVAQIPSEPKTYIQLIEEEDDPTDASIMDKINSAMLIDRLFLNPHLALEDLAAHIGTNRTYVSTAISQVMHTSFYDYINGYRIKYAQEYMMRHPNATQEVVAEESGFANASAFNRKFKQVTQTTPRLWLLQTHH